jgi:hypothetical protein
MTEAIAKSESLSAVVFVMLGIYSNANAFDLEARLLAYRTGHDHRIQEREV